MIIIGFHGFATTPQNSNFCRELEEHYSRYKNIEVICPQYNYLTSDPSIDFNNLDSIVRQYQNERIFFYGISLGGFVARHFAVKYDKPMILFNPSVMPWNDVDRYIRRTPILNNNLGRFLVRRVKKAAVLCKKYFFDNHIENQTVVLSKDDDILDWNFSYGFFDGYANLIIEDIGGHNLDINKTLNNTLEQIDENILHVKEQKESHTEEGVNQKHT